MGDYINKNGIAWEGCNSWWFKKASPMDGPVTIFMNTFTSVTPYTNNTWQILDLSDHVPIGAKQVLLGGLFAITNGASETANVTVAFRRPGETFDYNYNTEAISGPLANEPDRSSLTMIAPVDSNRHTEIKPHWFTTSGSAAAGISYLINASIIGFGYGDTADQPPAEVSAAWHTVCSATMGLNGSGMQNSTIVAQINGPFSNGASKARVTVYPNGSLYGSTIVNKCYIGKRAGSGDPYDFDGGQVQVFFSGSAGVTLPQGGSGVTSDEVTIALVSSDNVLVACELGNAPAMGAGASTAVISHYKTSAAESGTTNKTGYITVSGYSYLVGKLEFYQ